MNYWSWIYDVNFPCEIDCNGTTFRRNLQPLLVNRYSITESKKSAMLFEVEL